jgi:hypothetical protein
MGIEPSMVDRIFLPFVRLGTRNVPGAGIGFSIVKTIVEPYEGSVSLDSTPGMGSTFYVHLPVISWNPSLFPLVRLQAIVTVSGNGWSVTDLTYWRGKRSLPSESDAR